MPHCILSQPRFNSLMVRLKGEKVTKLPIKNLRFNSLMVRLKAERFGDLLITDVVSIP